ncbi:hypothetical protein GOP47_0029079 [Adiantum capillus-veneris]|nr:hypothetical protein GOP47_0029079 [Adiantum capillus-veneris]
MTSPTVIQFCPLFLAIFLSLTCCGASTGFSRICNTKKGEGRKLASSQKLAAVNLGGWLVIEKWTRSSIWDGIPDADLLDGSQVQFKSVTLQKYMSAEGGGGQRVVVNRESASGWETFKIWRHTDGIYSFRVFDNQFISALDAGGGEVNATGARAREWESFMLTRNPSNNRVHIKAYNGMYLQAKDENQLTADYVSSSEPDWGDNPATFKMTINVASPYHGEYQLANGWGPEKAASVFEKHRDSFITAADFQYLSSIGINGVRIPVGYWIAKDPDPPNPFVAGSLKALDNAFSWAESHKIKIIIDLHAAPGSQNGQEHSATIDGVSEWARGIDASSKKSYIDLTLEAIDFLASRYSHRSGLYGIELLNEPTAGVVPIDILKSYYKRGYDIVRKYSTSTYVIICQLLGADPSDLSDLGTQFSNAIIDLHYYNVFGDTFARMDVQENIEYIYNNRSQEIRKLNKGSNGLLTFVGEWTNEWAYKGASQAEYQKFGQAQLQVYGEATAGWAYWTYIIDDSGFNHWDFKQSYQKNYIQMPSNGWLS